MSRDTLRFVLMVAAGLAGAPVYWLAGSLGVFLYIVGILIGSVITTMAVDKL